MVVVGVVVDFVAIVVLVEGGVSAKAIMPWRLAGWGRRRWELTILFELC